MINFVNTSQGNSALSSAQNVCRTNMWSIYNSEAMKWWNCSGGDSSAQSFCRSGFFRQLFWRTDGWDYCWEKAWLWDKNGPGPASLENAEVPLEVDSAVGEVWMASDWIQVSIWHHCDSDSKSRPQELQGQLVLTSRAIPRSTESRLGQLYIYDPSTNKN